jgi:predicted small lipoprotein YifL
MRDIVKPRIAPRRPGIGTILVAMKASWTGFCLLLLLFVSLAGCGSKQPPRPTAEPRDLTAAEQRAAESGLAAIRGYCRRVGADLAGRAGPPDPAVLERAVAGARAIATLARRKPDAPYSRVQTARELAADTAEDLEGTNCSATLVAELARGL